MRLRVESLSDGRRTEKVDRVSLLPQSMDARSVKTREEQQHHRGRYRRRLHLVELDELCFLLVDGERHAHRRVARRRRVRAFPLETETLLPVRSPRGGALSSAGRDARRAATRQRGVVHDGDETLGGGVPDRIAAFVHHPLRERGEDELSVSSTFVVSTRTRRRFASRSTRLHRIGRRRIDGDLEVDPSDDVVRAALPLSPVSSCLHAAFVPIRITGARAADAESLHAREKEHRQRRRGRARHGSGDGRLERTRASRRDGDGARVGLEAPRRSASE